ncbi:MAG: PHP domain-containing protein [Dehalococcoidia bacterium]|nr:PHP domain-containing protein [Dehalococcoidia bacterium]
MLRADLHIHTRQSIDSYMTYEQLIAACQANDINCIGVADHGTTLGALELSKIAPFKIIICEEVRTPDGEIMGMFLQEDIPDKIPLDEAVKRIRDQGGLICIPHPYDLVRPSALRKTKVLEKLADIVDIIEVYNSRSLFPGTEKRALSLARRHGRLISAGSDAHSPSELGYAIVEMQDFTGPQEFLASLKNATIHSRKSSPLIHFLSVTARVDKNINKR